MPDETRRTVTTAAITELMIITEIMIALGAWGAEHGTVPATWMTFLGDCAAGATDKLVEADA